MQLTYTATSPVEEEEEEEHNIPRHFSLDSPLFEMANYSRPHICHCLTRIASVKRNAVVTVYGQRRRTGQEFVDGVLKLAGGLVRLGLRNGDVVSVAALNRSNV